MAPLHRPHDRSRSSGSVRLVVVAWVLAGAGACGIRPLTSAELYGAGGAGAAAGAGGTLGTAGTGGAAGGAGTSDAAVDQMPDTQEMPDAPIGDGGDDAPGVDSGTDAAGADSGADAAPPGCPQPCDPDQFCDELTDRCAPRAGTGMLSGTVTDPCINDGVDARVGIAGQHACSFVSKGSYFFSNLPLGRLKLAAAKEGYELYGATIEIVPGGVIHDIALVRTGGCTAPRPTVACTCTDASCKPRTP